MSLKEGADVVSERLKRAGRKAPLVLAIMLALALPTIGLRELGETQSAYDWGAARETLEEVQVQAQSALDDLSLTIQDCEGVLARVEEDGGADPSALATAQEACAEAKALVLAGVAATRRPHDGSFIAQMSAQALSLSDASCTRQKAIEAGDSLLAAMDAVVWDVAYHDDFLGQAADDGSVTQWAEGFFLAHRWSANGKRIASLPAYVRVDGRLYRYVSSTTVQRGTLWEDIEGFVHENGGIGFETCVDDADESAYLITHYEPL